VLPAEIRRQLGLRPKDRVIVTLEDDRVVVVPLRASVEASFQAVPALDRPRSDREVAAIAWEDHADEVAREGL
jgi:AbrB family looped-hinge helix DNA binding protein